MEKCPYLESCPFYNDAILPDFAKEHLKEKYCGGFFEECARKIIKDKGEEVSSNLAPNGRRIATSR